MSVEKSDCINEIPEKQKRRILTLFNFKDISMKNQDKECIPISSIKKDKQEKGRRQG